MSFFQFSASDIALDADGDLLIQNGDFAQAPSDGAHIKHVIESAKGNWRFKPLLGVDITGYINATGTLIATKLRKNIKAELESDGYLVKDVKTNENQPIIIDALRIK
jgi:hypothetical protein